MAKSKLIIKSLDKARKNAKVERYDLYNADADFEIGMQFSIIGVGTISELKTDLKGTEYASLKEVRPWGDGTYIDRKTNTTKKKSDDLCFYCKSGENVLPLRLSQLSWAEPTYKMSAKRVVDGEEIEVDPYPKFFKNVLPGTIAEELNARLHKGRSVVDIFQEIAEMHEKETLVVEPYDEPDVLLKNKQGQISTKKQIRCFNVAK